MNMNITVLHNSKVSYAASGGECTQTLFKNIECNQHLERDLQKVADDNPEHTWAKKMKELISSTIKGRKDAISEGTEMFADEYIQHFHKKMRQLIKKGYKESAVSTNPTTVPAENTLLKRIEEYFPNYFRWIENFSFPTTDNLSERGLRSIKSHMKISGQYENEQTASVSVGRN